MSDIFRWAASTDVALFNLGFISRSNQLYRQEEIRQRDLEQLVPWSDSIVVFETDGASVRNVIEKQLEMCAGKSWCGNFPIFSGFEARWDMQAPSGSRLLHFSLADDQIVSVVTNSYVLPIIEGHMKIFGFKVRPADALSEMALMQEQLRKTMEARSCTVFSESVRPNPR